MEHFPAFTVSLFLFAGFTAVFSAGQHVETYYVEAGSKSFTLPLPTVYKADPEDILTWKRNTIVVTKVSQSGALELPAEDLKVAGQVYVYTLEVFNKDGQLKFNMKSTLHLLEKLGTPSLSFNCQDEVVVFNCNVSQSKDLVYAWTVNNVTQSKKTPTLEVQWEDIGKSVRCTVSNKAGKKDSQEVIAVCGGAVTTRTTSSNQSGNASFEGAVRAVGVSHVLECFQLNVVGVLVLLLINRGLV